LGSYSSTIELHPHCVRFYASGQAAGNSLQGVEEGCPCRLID
jgi:hypothetical protein